MNRLVNLRRRDSQLSALVVDDDEGVRELLAGILRDADFDVVAAEDGEQALALARNDVPALALVDVQLPGLSGYEVVRRMRNEFGDDLGIMIVSGSRMEPLDRAAGLEMGADDYMLKPFDPTELVARARALVRRVKPPLDTRGGRLTERSLTPRELEVLRLLARGKAAHAIAERLVITPRTVAKHIERILVKLGVHSRAEAVGIAYREGLVDEHEAPPDEDRQSGRGTVPPGNEPPEGR